MMSVALPLVATLAASNPAQATPSSETSQRVALTARDAVDLVRGEEILVDFVDDISTQAVRAYEDNLDIELELNSIHSEDERIYTGHVDLSRIREVLAALQDRQDIEYAEPNYVFELIEPVTGDERTETFRPEKPSPVVNDPRYGEQWSFPLIEVPAAWETANGQGVVVAVIDTGVAFEDHKGFRKVEDLGGTAFVTGYDFVKDTHHPNDDHGHGTHVAGTIAQTTNNGVGVAGVAPEAVIMPLKVLSKRGAGTAGDIADAIRFAADEGAQVINMSLGGGPRSFVMESAIKHAVKKGVLVVCAAGNGAREKVEYPAAYKGSLAVSSIGPDRKLAFYSSYGAQVSVTAPGGNKQLGEAAGILQNTILPVSVDRTDAYLAYQGTSMAAPHVAGLAALVISAGVDDPEMVRHILESTATDLGPRGHDPRYGHGLINARAAVQAAKNTRSGPGWLAVAAALLMGLLTRGGASLRLGALLGGGVAASAFGLAGMGGFVATALWASVGIPLILVVGMLHQRRWRAVLLGLATGWAMLLLYLGIQLPWDLIGMPGTGSWLDRIWLLINALATGWLAWRIRGLIQRARAASQDRS
ncbi:MAG: S8 family serine peptidase [Myxococcota bacterium]